MSVKFIAVEKLKIILSLLEGMDQKALGDDDDYFLERFIYQDTRDKKPKTPLDLVEMRKNALSSSDIKMYAVVNVNQEYYNQVLRPAVLIVRHDSCDVLTVCCFDAGDINETPATMKMLGILCDKYKAVRFHVNDERVKHLARYAGYDVRLVEYIFLATRKKEVNDGR